MATLANRKIYLQEGMLNKKMLQIEILKRVTFQALLEMSVKLFVFFTCFSVVV